MAKLVALLVDDDRMMRLLAKKIIESEGFEVVEAATGEDALSLFESRNYNIVLLDALMPGIDGFETCRRLRELPGGSSMPVLMITGLDDTDAYQQAKEVEAVAIIPKPLNRELLKEKLRAFAK